MDEEDMYTALNAITDFLKQQDIYNHEINKGFKLQDKINDDLLEAIKKQEKINKEFTNFISLSLVFAFIMYLKQKNSKGE